MDKKNTIIGVILLTAGLILMMRDQAAHRRQMVIEQDPPSVAQKANEVPVSPPLQQTPLSALPSSSKASASQPSVPDVVDSGMTHDVSNVVLENDLMRVSLTHQGASIQSVAFIGNDQGGTYRYPESLGSAEPYRFNLYSPVPALALAFQLKENAYPTAYLPFYDLVNATKTSAQFSHMTDDGIRITRTYTLGDHAENPYVITHTTNFTRSHQASLDLSHFFLHLGSFFPTKGDVWKEYLSAGYHQSGDTTFISSSEFEFSEPTLGFGGNTNPSPHYPYLPEEKRDLYSAPLSWAFVKNQFFTSIFLPDQPIKGLFTAPLFSPELKKDLSNGLEGYAEFRLTDTDFSKHTYTITARYYTGPKSYFNIKDFTPEAGDIMEFQFFSGLSKLMLWSLQHIYDLIAQFSPSWAWGFSIILLTIIIKTLLWPITNIQLRSARNMSKIQKPLKELQEKYKNNPKKIQEETLKLFKANGVNPLGCLLPLIIQFPIFIALFFMLRTSSDLRFAPFLWIQDLSTPDLVGNILSIPIHPMAFAMAATMILQMRLTPSTTADPMQKRIMQLLPIIFLFFCYGFPSGLTLYWTTQNLITIFQQKINQLRDKNNTPTITHTPPPNPFRKKNT